MHRLTRLLRELKRRNVYRTVITYAVAVLGIVEAAALIASQLELDSSIVTVLLVAGLVGFPAAAALAWRYRITEDGFVRHGTVDQAEGRGEIGPFVAAVATFIVLAGIGWWLFAGRGQATARSAEPTSRNSIAVMPFRDLSRDGDLGWLGHGLAEEILAALSKIPDIEVVARGSSFAMEGERPGTVGEELDVTHVLTGSVQSEGELATISAQLVEVEGEREVWARDFRPKLGQYAEARQQIARSVVDALEVELGAIESSRLMGQTTTDPLAHEHYLRGLQLWNRRSEAAILRAIDHFSTAVELDPAYAAAWAGLSYGFLVLPEYSPTADVQMVRARSRAAATWALELDPDQTDALTALGWGRLVHDYDWSAAEELIGRALELDSTNVRALHWQSHVFSWQGRHQEAVGLASRAAELDPLSPIMRQNLAYILMEAGEYEQALTELGQVLAQEPNYAVSIRTTWNIETRRGRFQEAARALERWLIIRGRDAAAAGELAREFAEDARSFTETGNGERLTPALLARVDIGLEVEGQLHAAVGDADRALATLEQAYRERAGARNLLSVGINPLYDFLRDDPRLQELIARLGL